jgi:hypothetical protein
MNEVADDEDDLDGLQLPFIEWEQESQILANGPDCGCSTRCCRANPEDAVGLLTEEDRACICRFMDILQPPAPPAQLTSNGVL